MVFKEDILMLFSFLILFSRCASDKADFRKNGKPEAITMALYSPGVLPAHASSLAYPKDISHAIVEPGSSERQFLHDPAIIFHNNELIAGWDSRLDIDSYTSAAFRTRRSVNGGGTWSEFETVAQFSQERGGFYFTSMQFLSHNSELYAIASKMIGKGVKACTIFKYNSVNESWTELSDITGPFMPNQIPVKMQDGNWIMGGRAVSGYGQNPSWPLFPAVAINQGDSFTKPWRIVLLQSHEFEADQIPETTVIVEQGNIQAFTRRNGPGFTPYLYKSKNYGQNWEKIASHDFRSTSSKIYASTLRDGRGYVIFNYPVEELIGQGNKARAVLAIAVSKDNNPFSFSGIYKVQAAGSGKPFISHYPSATEYNGKLYVAYTAHFDPSNQENRQCEVAVIPLSSLK